MIESRWLNKLVFTNVEGQWVSLRDGMMFGERNAEWMNERKNEWERLTDWLADWLTGRTRKQSDGFGFRNTLRFESRNIQKHAEIQSPLFASCNQQPILRQKQLRLRRQDRLVAVQTDEAMKVWGWNGFTSGVLGAQLVRVELARKWITWQKLKTNPFWAYTCLHFACHLSPCVDRRTGHAGLFCSRKQWAYTLATCILSIFYNTFQPFSSSSPSSPFLYVVMCDINIATIGHLRILSYLSIDKLWLRSIVDPAI